MGGFSPPKPHTNPGLYGHEALHKGARKGKCLCKNEKQTLQEGCGALQKHVQTSLARYLKQPFLNIPKNSCS